VGTVISLKKERFPLENATLDMLGTAVDINKDNTTIVNGAGSNRLLRIV
jgi:chaperonin GroEL